MSFTVHDWSRVPLESFGCPGRRLMDKAARAEPRAGYNIDDLRFESIELQRTHEKSASLWVLRLGGCGLAPTKVVPAVDGFVC